MLDKILARKQREGVRMGRRDAIVLNAITEKGGSHHPSVRQAQGRREADRRTPAQRRRDRRQRLVALRAAGSKRA